MDIGSLAELELIIEGHQQALKSFQEKLASVTHEEDKLDGFFGPYLRARGAKHYANAIKITQFRLKIDQEALRQR